jgi:hypothetical protein
MSITSTTPIPACSAGATSRQDRDVLVHTGAIAREGSEGRKKLRSSLLARHVTANLLQKRIIQKHA